MLLQAGAIGLIAVASTFGVWLLAAVLLGLGTAMVYPTLLAAVADVAAPPGAAPRSASIASGATSASSSGR